MNYTRPRYDTPGSKLFAGIFLLVIGGMANQFWNIPRQQGQMEVLQQRMQAMEIRMAALEQQHLTMMGQLDRLQRQHEQPAKP